MAISLKTVGKVAGAAVGGGAAFIGTGGNPQATLAGAQVGAKAGGGIGSLLSSSAELGVGAYLGKRSQEKFNAILRQIQNDLGVSWEEAQDIFSEKTKEALAAIEAGNSEAADAIMQGLGMSIATREKYFGIASDALDWVETYGQSGIKEEQKFMDIAQTYIDYHQELLFNPDAIYGTELYKSIQNITTEALQNEYSSTGLLGGNAMAALQERLAAQAYDFRTGELNAAAQGANLGFSGAELAQRRVAIGANAAGQRSDLAFNAGQSIGNDQFAAGGAIAGIAERGGVNMAQLLAGEGQFLAQGATDHATTNANIMYGGGLSNRETSGGLASHLISEGVQGLSGFFDQLGSNKTSTPGTLAQGNASSFPGGGANVPTTRGGTHTSSPQRFPSSSGTPRHPQGFPNSFPNPRDRTNPGFPKVPERVFV